MTTDRLLTLALGTFVFGCSPNNAEPEAACLDAGGQCVASNSYCAVVANVTCPSSGPALFCCVDQVGSCGQPATTTYSPACSPDAGVLCRGTPPAPDLENVPVGVVLPPVELDAGFAQGCTITYPLCAEFGVYTCTCGGNGSPTWCCGPTTLCQ